MSRPKPGGISIGGLDVPAPEPIFELGIVGERRLLHEITRASELLQIGAAFGSLIVVEHGEGEIVDVGRDAKSEHQHQQRRAEQAEPEPDRVAQQLQGLADRIGQQALQAEPGTSFASAVPVGRIVGLAGARTLVAEARDPVASSR